MIEQRERPTIMSGKVVTYSTSFDEKPGIFGSLHEATGPFEVSASRDAVIVHRAELSTYDDVDSFVEAVKMARMTATYLATEGYGGNFARRLPQASEGGVKP